MKVEWPNQSQLLRDIVSAVVSSSEAAPGGTLEGITPCSASPTPCRAYNAQAMSSAIGKMIEMAMDEPNANKADLRAQIQYFRALWVSAKLDFQATTPSQGAHHGKLFPLCLGVCHKSLEWKEASEVRAGALLSCK